MRNAEGWLGVVSYEDYIATLEKAGYKITPPPPPRPVHHCMRCGKSEAETDEEWLTDIMVEVAVGEEGYSREMRYVCQDDMVGVLEALIKIGFSSHYHGSIVFLEDVSCPASGHTLPVGECLTPSKGPYEEDD
jgi:hypothetical protein